MGEPSVELADDPVTEPPVPERIGRYRILCELGRGGMGTIYLGRAEGPGGFERLMAIKLIHQSLCRERSFVDMFLDEARIAARIRHPNVVPVYEVDSDNGRYFITMDYVNGEPLSFVLNRARKMQALPFNLMAYVVAAACEGLHAAHELVDGSGRFLSVVHRDVSPHNIMIGYDGIVRVMDFGVAKAADQLSQTQPGFQKGKVAYMSPEHIRSEPIDRRADIFALGVVLWEATLGMRLFKGRTDVETAAKVLSGRVPLPSQIHQGYPREIERIIMKAVSLGVDGRYSTARQMSREIRGFLAQRPQLVSEDDLEGFMKQTFMERYRLRAEIESKAASVKPRHERRRPVVPRSVEQGAGIEGAEDFDDTRLEDECVKEVQLLAENVTLDFDSDDGPTVRSDAVMIDPYPRDEISSEDKTELDSDMEPRIDLEIDPGSFGTGPFKPESSESFPPLSGFGARTGPVTAKEWGDLVEEAVLGSEEDTSGLDGGRAIGPRVEEGSAVESARAYEETPAGELSRGDDGGDFVPEDDPSGGDARGRGDSSSDLRRVWFGERHEVLDRPEARPEDTVSAIAGGDTPPPEGTAPIPFERDTLSQVEPSLFQRIDVEEEPLERALDPSSREGSPRRARFGRVAWVLAVAAVSLVLAVLWSRLGGDAQEEETASEARSSEPDRGAAGETKRADPPGTSSEGVFPAGPDLAQRRSKAPGPQPGTKADLAAKAPGRRAAKERARNRAAKRVVSKERKDAKTPHFERKADAANRSTDLVGAEDL